MKKLTFAAFIAFWSSVATVLALSALAPEPIARADDDALASFTLTEVATHATAEACWMAIEGFVYDLTEYLPQHPTARSLLLAYCGTEATQGMRTKGYGRDHSHAAWAMLDDYLIGELADE